MYVTLQLLAGIEEGDVALAAAQRLRPWSDEDQQLLSMVQRTIQGHLHGDPQTSIRLDRSLATTGGLPLAGARPADVPLHICGWMRVEVMQGQHFLQGQHCKSRAALPARAAP